MMNSNKRTEKKLRSLLNPITENIFESSIGLKSGSNQEVLLRFPYIGFEDELNNTLSGTIKGGDLNLISKIYSHKIEKEIKPIKSIKNIIAVASGKGGVGKSTATVMLAKGLQQLGANVAILDADIYGPSIPKMLGDNGKPGSPDNKSFTPVDANGIQAMSLGYLVEEDAPAIWRGSMITKALMQMLEETRWKEIDYLLIDLPPGTGDIQLTMIQKIPVTATVIVTTPQDIALIDAQKALKMFQKVNIPVLGIIENMSTFQCKNCGHTEHIFGEGGGQLMETKYKVPLLGSLPLNIDIRSNMDAGKPDAIWAENLEMKNTCLKLAMSTAQNLGKLPININFNHSLKLKTL